MKSSELGLPWSTLLIYQMSTYIWYKVFNNGPSKICGKQLFMWKTKFCLSWPYSFKFSKGCLPQILLDAFLNTLSHIWFRRIQTDFAVFVLDILFCYFHLDLKGNILKCFFHFIVKIYPFIMASNLVVFLQISNSRSHKISEHYNFLKLHNLKYKVSFVLVYSFTT